MLLLLFLNGKYILANIAIPKKIEKKKCWFGIHEYVVKKIWSPNGHEHAKQYTTRGLCNETIVPESLC